MLDDFTYATRDFPQSQQNLIRLMERMLGKTRFVEIYESFHRRGRPGEKLWDALLDELSVTVDYDEARLNEISPDGPLIAIGNHPYGLVDSAAALHLLSKVRKDVRFFAHALAESVPELKPDMFPVDFNREETSRDINRKSLDDALGYLKQGGAVLIAPAGGVSTTKKWWERKATDLPWHNSTAKLALASNASIVPLHIAGQNSRLFQLASHVTPALRLGLFLRENLNLEGKKIHVSIGHAFCARGLDHNRRHITDYLREQVYRLAPGDGPS